MDLVEDFCDFLMHSPTSWHASAEMGRRLTALNFVPLPFDSEWNLEKGGRYFVIRDGSLAAFVLPKNVPDQMAIVLSHTDSPALKLKPCPFHTNHNMDLLNVETYGSPLLSTWVNRDLAIAGRIIVRQKNEDIEEHNVFFEDAPVFIPLLAPHLDREMDKKAVRKEHLVPILGLTEKGADPYTLEQFLKRQLPFEALIDFDLFLVPLESPRLMGKTGELLASYRLDNLASSHAALTAIGSFETSLQSMLPIAVFWDHEEVGSETVIGACSPFFRDIYDRICSFYLIEKEREVLLRQNSIYLSVDLAHAFNPIYEKHYDPHHLPLLGEGITLKYHANMNYTTTGRTGAFLYVLCDQLGLKLQRFVNHFDNRGGSTVGPRFAAQMGIEGADIGIPQLAMHASREVIACRDHLDMCVLLTAFFKGVRLPIPLLLSTLEEKVSPLTSKRRESGPVL